MVGLNVQMGSWLTTERVKMLGGGLLPAFTAVDESQVRGVALLSKQVRAQAYTMAIADGFVLIAWVVLGFLLVMLLLKPGRIAYKDLRKMQ